MQGKPDGEITCLLGALTKVTKNLLEEEGSRGGHGSQPFTVWFRDPAGNLYGTTCEGDAGGVVCIAHPAVDAAR